ncbi:unnamed protein product [Paramecium pentaurelia]|uniref:SRP54-type proteins GTP-binding domain-containing protein n=1 Tax=Paramecium pentaurelia TaxID=43138 RepID=A0A8S1VS14_9CILI|nr:unnamed protein product [Paramecium pentaurelia]
MIDLVSIITTGGVILFYKALCQIKEDVLGKVIDGCLQQKTQLQLGSMKVQWVILNELGLIFIVSYQEIFFIQYIDVLLKMLQTQFKQIYNPAIKQKGIYKSIPEFDSGFEEVMKMWQLYCDKRNEKEKEGPTKTYDQQEQFQTFEPKVETGNTPKEELNDGQQKLSKSEIIKMKMQQKSGTRSPKDGTKSPQDGAKSPVDSRSPKQSVIMNTNITKKQIESLDFTNKGQNQVQTNQNEKYMTQEQEDDLLKQFVGDDDPLFGSDDENPKQQKKQGLFSKLTGKIQNLTGNKQLTEEDLLPVLDDFKNALMQKNVAEEIAQKLVDSIKSNLLATKTKAFQSIRTSVQEAMKSTLTRILTPNRHIDIIAEALRSKEKQKPYVIVIIGVNGVGKSTTLAKLGYLFKSQGFSLMIAACDNFRAGAVEQLKTHGQCLGIPVYDRGYKDDPPEIAYQAIREATIKKIDVVLVDTAGRMQHNEPLMRALSRIVTMNNPDLVLFVGEALVGNDGVDQLVNFNKALIVNSPKDNVREIDAIILSKFDTVDEKVGAALSLTSATGKPILFVGVGQKYTHLKKLNVNTVVRALLQ